MSGDDDASTEALPSLPHVHLEGVKRTIRALTERPGKLETREFPPLTYVEQRQGLKPSQAGRAATASPRTDANDSAIEALRERLLAFQARLDPTQEVGIRVSGVDLPPMRLQSLHDLGHGLVSFEGTRGPGDPPCELVVHLTQLQVMLVRCTASEAREPFRLT